MAKFYISDTHFGHANILHFDNRPFKTTEEMEEVLVERWNAVVTKGDIVYILGDFCWKKESEWIRILNRLNGSKVLIVGNHDIRGSATLRKMFLSVEEYKEIEDEGRKVILCHYPIPFFMNHFYGSYHLYGHVHSSFEWNMVEHDKYLMEELYDRQCNMYNVGCMMTYMDYAPRTLDEIVRLCDGKEDNPRTK